MSSKIVGVIGGVGPGATSAFYKKTVHKYAERAQGDLPALLIYSIPIETQIERAILEGETGGPAMERMVKLLQTGVDTLACARVDAVVMPCNTLQAILPEMVERKGIPYIHLVSEVIGHIKRMGYLRTAVICTAPMRSLGLYQAGLDAQDVPYILPTEQEQDEITQTIFDTLHYAPNLNVRLRPIVRRLEAEADSLLLGCSDLTAFEDPTFTSLPIVDAMDVLVDSTVDFLLRERTL